MNTILHNQNGLDDAEGHTNFQLPVMNAFRSNNAEADDVIVALFAGAKAAVEVSVVRSSSAEAENFIVVVV